MRKKVNLAPALAVFLISFLVLTLGSILSVSITLVFGAFLVILMIAMVVLAASIVRR